MKSMATRFRLAAAGMFTAGQLLASDAPSVGTSSGVVTVDRARFVDWQQITLPKTLNITCQGGWISINLETGAVTLPQGVQLETAALDFWKAVADVFPDARKVILASARESRLPVLNAVRLVEGITDPASPGPAGELGFYRLTPGVWVQHTTAPFAWAATDPVLERWVAQRHLDWLERNLRAHGVPADAYSLALAWNAGLSATLRGRVSARARDYAQRVQNLCSEVTQFPSK